MIDLQIISSVRRRVARAFNLSEATLEGRSRLNEVAIARAVMFWVLRELGYTYKAIGLTLGYDHTSVLYGCNMTSDRMKSSSDISRSATSVLANCEREFGSRARDVKTEAEIIQDYLKEIQIGDVSSKPWVRSELLSIVVCEKARSVVLEFDPRRYQVVSVPVSFRNRNFKVHFEAQVKNGFLGFELIDFQEELGGLTA